MAQNALGISVSQLKARLRDDPIGAFAFYGPEELLKQFYLQKFVAQMLRVQTGTGMHIEAAKAHLLQHFDLPEQLILLQFAVPCPKCSSSVFTIPHQKTTLFL